MLNQKSKTSTIVSKCQICGSTQLEPVLFVGFLPPVNSMQKIGSPPDEQASYPAQLLFCHNCSLVQIGLIVSPKILFPPQYPYASSTTKILRDNFAQLYKESSSIIPLAADDLIVDIGSNDGNLLSNFTSHRVLGITPEDIGQVAIRRGIPTLIEYFNGATAKKVLAEYGKAKLVTATNVFAHIDCIHDIVNAILLILKEEGVFISESHYLLELIKNLQYDTIYHEHLRYYSLHSLKYLLERHGLEIFHARQIPTHGGSIRVYAARKGNYPVRDSVAAILKMEQESGILDAAGLEVFKERVVMSKLSLMGLLQEIKNKKQRIYGIGGPSRAGTLINYVGLDEGMLDCILEVNGSYKIGNYMPGTLIPILEESKLYDDNPHYALLLSWHIADELIANLKKKGYRGKFIIPLPQPRIVE